MDLSLDPAYGLLARREATVAAQPAGTETTSSPITPATAVVAPAAGSAGKRAADGGAGEGAGGDPAEQERSAEAEPRDPPSPPARTGAYDRRLVYENAYERLFLDVVDREKDERVMRIPSEKLVDYLQHMQEGAASEPAATAPSASLDTRV